MIWSKQLCLVLNISRTIFIPCNTRFIVSTLEKQVAIFDASTHKVENIVEKSPQMEVRAQFSREQLFDSPDKLLRRSNFASRRQTLYYERRVIHYQESGLSPAIPSLRISYWNDRFFLAGTAESDPKPSFNFSESGGLKFKSRACAPLRSPAQKQGEAFLYISSNCP